MVEAQDELMNPVITVDVLYNVLDNVTRGNFTIDEVAEWWYKRRIRWNLQSVLTYYTLCSTIPFHQKKLKHGGTQGWTNETYIPWPYETHIQSIQNSCWDGRKPIQWCMAGKRISRERTDGSMTISLQYLMVALTCLDTGKAPPNTAIPCSIEWFNQNILMNEYIPWNSTMKNCPSISRA